MRIAFYAPLNAPVEGTPSGDRRVAVLLMQALQIAGHAVDLVSTFRSFDGAGDPPRQERLRREGLALADVLLKRWCAAPASARPQLWFTYHLYHKAPDWLGPAVSRSLDIPYVIAEPSHAAKRASGNWALGHHACESAIRQASLLLCPSHDDMPALSSLLGTSAHIVHLPPFLNTAAQQAQSGSREIHRTRLRAAHHIDPRSAWLLAVGMMRPGDKLASYRALAATLALLADRPWSLLIAGDGPMREEVIRVFAATVPGRAVFLGELGQVALAEVYAACDLLVWPAVNEAYGMALLEAQAAGLPVVASRVRGVPDVVRDGTTGLLAPGGDHPALAACVRELLDSPARRSAMGQAARHFVADSRSLEVAAQQLAQHLSRWG